MKTYCSKCGHGMSYSGAKPKFCSNCGNPTSSLAKQENKNYKIQEDIEDEEYESESEEDQEALANLRNMSSLSVEIDTENTSRTTFSDIAKSSGGQVKGDINLPKREVPQIDAQQTLNEFKKEAGTLRNNNA